MKLENNVTIQNLNITQFEEGVWILGSTYVNITNNYINGCDQGITLVSNTFYNEGRYIYAAAMNNSIIGNTIEHNGNGINLLGASCLNTIDSNIIRNNGDAGIYSQGDSNTVKGNIIGENLHGTWLDGSNNSFIGNSFAHNNESVVLYIGGHYNLFYLNNFINNTKPLAFASKETFGVWDNGSVGNYWSNYNGTDADNDSIGDKPYVLAPDNVDNYPLMVPHEIKLEERQPQSWLFPAPLVITLSATLLTIASVGVLVYFKKRKR